MFGSSTFSCVSVVFVPVLVSSCLFVVKGVDAKENTVRVGLVVGPDLVGIQDERKENVVGAVVLPDLEFVHCSCSERRCVVCSCERCFVIRSWWNR